MIASGSSGMVAAFFVVSKSLFQMIFSRVNKNFVSVFIATLTNSKSTNIRKGIE